MLGLLVVGLLAVGGRVRTGGPGSVPIRVLVSIGTVILARLALGTSGAALAAILLALGAWLRLGFSDAIVGLAVFGGVVALLGSASLRIAAVFWALGIAAVLVRSHAPLLWRRAFRRRALIAEKAQPSPLAPES